MGSAECCLHRRHSDDDDDVGAGVPTRNDPTIFRTELPRRVRGGRALHAPDPKSAPSWHCAVCLCQVDGNMSEVASRNDQVELLPSSGVVMRCISLGLVARTARLWRGTRLGSAERDGGFGHASRTSTVVLDTED